MRYILLACLSFLALACSGDVNENQTREIKPVPTENKSVNPLQPQAQQPEKHISGSGETRISGASSSSHISGQ
jgi:hypothetical protein